MKNEAIDFPKVQSFISVFKCILMKFIFFALVSYNVPNN